MVSRRGKRDILNIMNPFFRAAVVCILATVFASNAVASPARDTLHVRGVADTVTMLKPVIVDEHRANDSARGTGTRVQVDRGKLVRFQPPTTGDALLAAPGVDLVKTGAWDSRVAVRGMSGERVLVLVDGVRLQTGRGHGAQTSLVAVDQLESLELLPGAGSSQFGSDALGGVVNLVTHRSLFAAQPAATLTLTGRVSAPGDGEGAHGRLRVKRPHWGVELGGGLDRLGAVVTPDMRLPNSGDHEQDLGARAAVQWGPATIDAEHSRHAAYDIGLPAFTTDAGGSGRYAIQSRDLDRVEITVPRNGAAPEFGLLAVQQRFRTGFDEVSVDSLFVRRAFRGLQRTAADDRITTWSRSLQPTLRCGAFRFYGEWRHESTGGPRSTDFVTTNTLGQVTATSSSAGESVPPARRTVVAGGASAGATWFGVHAEGGARFDWQRSSADSTPSSFTSALDVTDRRWNAEGGLSRAIGGWTPYVHAGSGYRAPNLEERYFNDDVHGGMRLFGNPALVAEKSFNTELGLRVSDAFSGRLPAARVSAYRSEVRDLISLKYLGMLYGVPRFQYTNIARARLEGVEVQSDARFAGTQVACNAAFPRGRDEVSGKPVTDLGAARVTLDLRVPVAGPFAAAAISLRGRWTDAATVSTGEDILARPAFWTGDAEFSCTFAGARWALAVRNVTNTRYREPLSFLDEAGRTWSLAVRRDLVPSGIFAHP